MVLAYCPISAITSFYWQTDCQQIGARLSALPRGSVHRTPGSRFLLLGWGRKSRTRNSHNFLRIIPCRFPRTMMIFSRPCWMMRLTMVVQVRGILGFTIGFCKKIVKVMDRYQQKVKVNLVKFKEKRLLSMLETWPYVNQWKHFDLSWDTLCEMWNHHYSWGNNVRGFRRLPLSTKSRPKKRITN